MAKTRGAILDAAAVEYGIRNARRGNEWIGYPPSYKRAGDFRYAASGARALGMSDRRRASRPQQAYGRQSAPEAIAVGYKVRLRETRRSGFEACAPAPEATHAGDRGHVRAGVVTDV